MRHFQNLILQILFFVAIFPNRAYSQKPLIDSSTYDSWQSVEDGKICGDGNFVSYYLETHIPNDSKLILQSIDNRWRMVMQNAKRVNFSSNSKYAVFLLTDTLAILKLGSSSIDYFPHIRDFKLVHGEFHDWLLYSVKNEAKSFIILDINSQVSKTIDSVLNFINKGNSIIVKTKKEFRWIKLDRDSSYTFWPGKRADNFVLNKSESELLFTTEINDTCKSIMIFKPGMTFATQLIDNNAVMKSFGLNIGRIQRTTEDGNWLFLDLVEVLYSKSKRDNIPIAVWSYLDEKLQTFKARELQPKSFSAILSLETKSLLRLQLENESIFRSTLLDNTHENIALIDHRNGDYNFSEANWNPAAKGTEYLLNIKTNTRTAIKELDGTSVQDFHLSPNEKFVLFYDRSQKNFFSYEIHSGHLRNVTKNISTIWEDNDTEHPSEYLFTQAFSAWFTDGRFALLHDNYDMWKIDLLGIRPPINVTNGYGKRNKIEFRLAINKDNNVLADTANVILNAFNVLTKDNGFYTKSLKTTGDPKCLTMGPFIYHLQNLGFGMEPIKSDGGTNFLVKRMSATESPNYYYTHDFKNFSRVSDIHPENNYNWLTSELVSWISLDGRPLQGVLYKPENFDRKRKYPLIFYYYERKSHMKNAYLIPKLSEGDLNIVQYVSNGYLVFTPDIRYTIGETGESVVNSVVSAAKYMSTMPWVNSKKMGIQGMSFGAYETNYLVTHSNLFTAACSSSGIADLISNYGSLQSDGNSLQYMHELDQFRIGKSLLEDHDIYIKNSPLFNVKNVTTPLLMMHTTGDGICPFSNAIEFFTALRRMRKKVWLLQYEGNHSVLGNSAKDYALRMQEFFDHFLKDSPTPEWMKQEVK